MLVVWAADITVLLPGPSRFAPEFGKILGPSPTRPAPLALLKNPARRLQLVHGNFSQMWESQPTCQRVSPAMPSRRS